MHRGHPSTRRELLQAGGLGLFGLTLPNLLAGRATDAAPTESTSAIGGADPDTFGRARSCILLFMWGGPAHQETWDLKPDAPAEIRGEFSPLDTVVPGIRIGEHFPLLAQRTRDLAIIRSMTHGDVNHTTSTHHLLTGKPSPPLSNDLRGDWPHIGSVLAHEGRGEWPLPPFLSFRPKPKVENDVPRFVEESHGQFAGWLGQRYDPLTIDADPSQPDYRVGDFVLQPELSVDRLDDRRRLRALLDEQRRRFETAATRPAAVDRHYERAFDLLDSAVGRSAFDLTAETDETRDRYGRTPHGQSVLQARRLVEQGVPLVTVFWPSDGTKNVSVYWDTHSRNFVDLKTRLMPVADRAFSALLDDLRERNLLDETLVVWTGEFGRTPRVGQRNSDAGAGKDGRDHWPNCFSSVLAGGGVRGGQVYGASDPHAAYPAANATDPVDLVATIYHLLGIRRDLTLRDSQGRPLVVCDGEPIRALI